MSTKNEENEQEYCPVCDMPLEDAEACNFCDWKRIKLHACVKKEKHNE